MTIGPSFRGLKRDSLGFIQKVAGYLLILILVLATAIVEPAQQAFAAPHLSGNYANSAQTPAPEVDAGNLLANYFQVDLQLQTVTASGVADGANVGDTDIAAGPDNTYVFDWSSFVPQRPGDTVDWIEGDWIGQYESGNPGASHIDVQHEPAPGTADLDYYPSGGEEFDVEAFYFDNDANYFYVAIVTSVPFVGSYTNEFSGETYQALGVAAPELVLGGSQIGSTAGSLFYPGDLAIDLGVGTQRVEQNSSFGYDYGVDLVHEDRTTQVDFTSAGWIAADERDFELGDQLYKTEHDAGGSDNSPSADSAWYTSVFKGFTTGGWSHTNFDPIGFPSLVENRGAVQTAYYEYNFDGGNLENDSPTYIIEFVIPRESFQDDNPTNGDQIGIRWVEGCRNDGNGIDGVLTLTADIDESTIVSVGDQVWFDSNNNGLKDINENGIEGVEVTLWSADSAGAPVAPAIGATTTITDGYYLFDNLAPGDYIIQIADDQFELSGPLPGYLSSTGNGAAPDADVDASEDDDNGDPAAGLGVVSQPFTLSGGGEPTVDDESGISGSAPDNSSNQTIDFGFFEPVALGDQVWFDENNNNVKDAGESGIEGVTLRLWTDNDSDPIPDTDTGLTAVTNASGYYVFDNIAPGSYFVQIPQSELNPGGPLAGLSSSSFISPAPDPDDDVEDDDNGDPATGGLADGIISQAVTLVSGQEPDNDIESSIPATVPNLSSNKTVDFGFYTTPPTLLSLGDRVWLDTDNNGLLDNGEEGIAGVAVALWSDTNGDDIPDAPVGTPTTTNATGYYIFNDLAPGDYIVQIAPTEFVAGKPLNGLTSSTGVVADPDSSAIEDDDNGYPTSDLGVLSLAVTLSPGDEPQDDNEGGIPSFSPNDSSNKTVDFGFYQPQDTTLSLGDLVWFDTNNNGIKDTDESGIGGVTLTLWTVNDSGQPDQTTGTALTNQSGFYIFNDLAPGDYIVQIAEAEFAAGKPLAGHLSSTGNGEAADPDELPDENDDNGDPAANLGVISKPITLLVGQEPTDDNESNIPSFATNESSNKTVDFGFYLPDPGTTLSLGDQVWLDPNNNGIIDTGESGIASVEVVLWTADDSGNPIAAVGTPATTNTEGYYLFDGLEAGDYIVQIPASQFAAGGPLAEHTSSTGNEDAAGAPDPDNDTEDDDNGNLAGDLGVLSKPVTLLPNSEPTDDTGPTSGGATNENSNLTVDFGFFRPVSLGNRVWLDPDNSATLDAGEAGISGVTINLWADSDDDGGPDGSAPIATTTTDASGFYLFDNLLPGSYVVQIPASEFVSGSLAGHVSSSGNDGSSGAPDPDDNVDSDDNGDPAGDLGVVSKAVTLSYGEEPAGEAGNLPATGADTDSNQSVDFGFLPSQHSIGNYVWFDENNDGKVDATELPVPNGVVIELLAADMTTVLASDTTTNGFYLFTDLAAGMYKVRVASSNFADGGLLAGYTHSTGTNQEASPDSDGDQNDNGVDNTNPSINGIASGLITIGSDEPIGEAPTESGTAGDDGAGTADANSNLTVDFGVVQVAHSLGNYVWIDNNNNGVVDGGEAPVPNGVVLELLDSADNFLNRTAETVGGFYLFANLPAGDYKVRIAASNFTSTGLLPGYTHSTGAGQEADPNSDGDQNDNGLDGSTPSGSGITSGVVTIGTDEPVQETPTADSIAGSDGLNTPDASSNLTVDFGVVAPPTTVAIGNLVWLDQDNDGQFNPQTEQGLPGIEVQLFRAGSEPTSTAPIASQQTNAEGIYNFSNLEEGTYFVYIPNPPAEYPESSTPTDSGDNGEDLDDNGLQVGIGDPVRSPDIQLTAGGESATDGDGPNGDLTIDFGFWKPTYSLGNYVWIDSNDSGRADLIESPVSDGVLLELLNADGTDTGQTAETLNGFYLFSGLEAGDYRVRVAASNFAAGGLLEGYSHSTGDAQEDNPNDDGDQNDNGPDGSVLTSEGITSNIVTLNSEEPMGESPTANGQAGNDGNGTEDNKSNLTVDFGVVSPQSLVMSIGNLVWQDTNINGVVDAGEPGIDGIEVELYQAGADPSTDQPVATQTTSGGGLYEFGDLAPGVYFVYIPTPLSPFTGSSPVTDEEDNNEDDDDNGIQPAFNGPVRSPNITLTPNNEPDDDGNDVNGDLTVDFGFFNTPVAVGDKVWVDQNANGLLDPNEPGVPNVTVTLFKVSDPATPFFTTTTFDNGFYLFPAVPADDYFVQFDLSTLPEGFVPTQQNMGDNDLIDSDADPVSGITAPTGALEPGTSDLTLDLGIIPSASVGDFVWYDMNQDGIQNANETGLSGQTSQIGVPGVGVGLFNEAGEEVAFTMTGADGGYMFDGLLPGAYYLEFSPPVGYTVSPQNSSSDDDVYDSDVDPVSDLTPVFTLTAGQHDPTWDMGIYLSAQQPASLGDTVWFDANTDGIQDADEQGLPSITVELFNESGDKLAETTTDANGNYLFPNLVPATYFVQFTPPSDYQSSPLNSGSDDGQDSDADESTGRTQPVTLAAGEANQTLDAGFFLDTQPGSLGDTVWLDQNGNGLQDENLAEAGVPGIPVALYNDADELLAVTTTDTNGYYLFDKLPAGNYYVEFELPSGYEASPPGIGSDITVDSDADPQTLRTPVTAITPGENDTAWDLGIVQGPDGAATSALGNLVWEDTNANGMRDTGEPPIPNVTVKLYNEAGELYASTVTDVNGNYLFNNIQPGTYYVEFILPGDLSGGVQFTQRSSELNEDNDSDVFGTTGRTQAVIIPEGTVNLTLDAGIIVGPEPTAIEPDVEPQMDIHVYLPLSLR